MDFTLLADLKGQVLESPVWDDKRNCLFLCDIHGELIHQIALDGRILGRWEMQDQVASLGLCDSGRLVVALSRSVVLFDPATGQHSPLWQGFDEPATSRLNDGKIGPDGAFWVGSMDGRAEPEPISRLYRLTSQGAAVVMDGGVTVSNGLAWSADGRQMFWSDSRGKWIDRFDFDPVTGIPTNPIRLCDMDEARGRPDGGACDAEGFYWSAGVSAGVLNRFAPDGRLDRRLPFPVPAPTMPCFCGPDLRQMAVTSHRLRGDHPLSGGLFLAAAPVAGVPVARMKGV